MIQRIPTKRGYPFPAVSSAMQKAIRRGDAKLAGYWALELWASGYGQYVWRRLPTVSTEDCWGILTAEVMALHDSYTEINRNILSTRAKGRIFISKAVILLCLAKKSRDPDHLQNFGRPILTISSCNEWIWLSHQGRGRLWLGACRSGGGGL